MSFWRLQQCAHVTILLSVSHDSRYVPLTIATRNSSTLAKPSKLTGKHQPHHHVVLWELQLQIENPGSQILERLVYHMTSGARVLGWALFSPGSGWR